MDGLQCLKTVLYSPLAVLLLIYQQLIYSHVQYLIRVFKFDFDLNPSSWYFWWKQPQKSNDQLTSVLTGGMILKLVPFALSTAKKKKKKRNVCKWKLARGNYHKSVWNRASCWGDYGPLHPSLSPPPAVILSPPVCESLLTYNPNSFDRDYRVLIRDRETLGETEFWVMKQQCQGMIYEWLLPSFSLHRDAVGSNITFQKNSILTLHKVISVPFWEIVWHCLFNTLSQAFQWYVSNISP